MSATQLFAMAHGKPPIPGAEQCGLCGGSCDGSLLVASVLSDSFTDWQHVAGDYLCASCLLTLRSEERADQPRLYSWVLTESKALKYTKANLAELREHCLAPPKPPYAIVLAESGQRHLLYRASIIHDPVMAGAYLEGEQIGYAPHDLDERLSLCRQIVAASAKGALDQFDPVPLAIALESYWTNWEEIFHAWERVYSEPLSRLAAFLCENRKDCQDACPSDRISAAVAGPADTAKVPVDPRRTRGPEREPREPGLFG